MDGITSPPMAQSGTTSSVFSPLLISMLGIVVTSMAIITYHLILVKYCIRRHGSTTATAATQSTPAPQPPTGVDEKVLETIPILPFSAVKSDMDREECVVCLGELEEEELVRLLPNCKHAFHVTCIDQWFAAHTSCPLCRSPIHKRTNSASPRHPHHADDSDRAGSSEHRATINSNREPPLSGEQSLGLLRHCASLVFPPPPQMERRSSSPLKRSLSMDHSSVIINCLNASSSSSSSGGVLSRSGSLSHFDRVSCKWLRSFSRLRVGKGSNGAILPY